MLADIASNTNTLYNQPRRSGKSDYATTPGENKEEFMSLQEKLLDLETAAKSDFQWSERPPGDVYGVKKLP